MISDGVARSFFGGVLALACAVAGGVGGFGVEGQAGAAIGALAGALAGYAFGSGLVHIAKGVARLLLGGAVVATAIALMLAATGMLG